MPTYTDEGLDEGWHGLGWDLSLLPEQTNSINSSRSFMLGYSSSVCAHRHNNRFSCIKPKEPQNEIKGTPMFVAPEVFDGEPASEKTDVYAYGVLRGA